MILCVLSFVSLFLQTLFSTQFTKSLLIYHMWWFRRDQYWIISSKQTLQFSDADISVISHAERDELITQHCLFMDLLDFPTDIFTDQTQGHIAPN